MTFKERKENRLEKLRTQKQIEEDAQMVGVSSFNGNKSRMHLSTDQSASPIGQLEALRRKRSGPQAEAYFTKLAQENLKKPKHSSNALKDTS